MANPMAGPSVMIVSFALVEGTVKLVQCTSGCTLELYSRLKTRDPHVHNLSHKANNFRESTRDESRSVVFTVYVP